MTDNRSTRRKFLKLAGLAIGGSAVACCGLGVALTPPAQTAEPVETTRSTFGKDETMQKPILVVYATRTGSTVGVAEKIAETLAQRGAEVEVKPVADNPDPAAYQAVVVGSAVNGGKWLPEAVEYVQRYQQTLQKMPLSLFCVHILNRGDDAGSRKNRLAYLNDVRALLNPASGQVKEGFFTGKGMDPKTTAPLLMWVMRLTNFVPEGDCRDWAKIKAWAENLFV